MGGGAVTSLLGSFDGTPERYAVASPAALAPLGVPQLLVHGDADDIVPIRQSRDYAAQEPEAELMALPGADHFDVIDASHAAWPVAVERIVAYVGREGRARTG